jgi:hypothetical protein
VKSIELEVHPAQHEVGVRAAREEDVGQRELPAIEGREARVEDLFRARDRVLLEAQEDAVEGAPLPGELRRVGARVLSTDWPQRPRRSLRAALLSSARRASCCRGRRAGGRSRR